MNNLITTLILIQLICLCNSENNVTENNKLFENYKETTQATSNDLTVSGPSLLEGDNVLGPSLLEADNPDCFNDCRRCEVCVEGYCLPYVEESLYTEPDEQGECTLRDLCNETEVRRCPNGICRPAYGFYSCECEHNMYGLWCEEKMEDVLVRNIQVIYRAMMKAVGSYDKDHIDDSKQSVMVSWQADSTVSDTLTLEYSVLTPEFSDLRTFTQGQVDPDPIRTCDNIITDIESCKQYYGSGTHYSIVFLVRFPFIPENPSDTKGIEIVKLNYTGKPDLIGYKINFVISIKASSFSYKNMYSLFVYYERVWSYKHDCFPLKIQPTSCVDHWSLVTSTEDQNIQLIGYKNSFREMKTISASALTKGGQSDSRARCNFEYSFFYVKDKPNLDPKYKGYRSTKMTESLFLRSFTADVGVYRVEIEGRVVTDIPFTESMGNFAVCFFEVYKEPLKAVIQGGDSRTVYANEDLIMDATGSEDPNNPPGMQTNLLFTWWCNQQNDKICKMYKTKARKYVIKAPIPPNVVYDFRLVVSAFNQSKVSTMQKVTTTADKFASFSIICRKNCGDDKGSNPRKPIYLETIIKGKEYLDDDEFKWSYIYSDKSKKTLNSKLPPIEDIKADLSASNICIIFPEVLEEGKYSFTALRVRTQGAASYSITIGASPTVSKGCSVKRTPSDELPDKSNSGVLEPSYEIQCEVLPVSVNYMFYLSDGDSENLPIYFIDTVEAKAKNVLNYKTKEEDNKNTLKVKFYYESGHFSVVDVNDETGIFKPSALDISKNDDDENFVYMWLEEILEERLDTIRRNPTKYEVVQYFNTLLSLAYTDFPKTNFLVVLHLFFYELFVEIEMFENYYDIISVLSPFTRCMQRIGVPALETDFSTNDKLTIAIATKLFVIIRHFEDYENFFQYDKMISIDEFIQISKSIFDCLRLLFNSLYNAQSVIKITPRKIKHKFFLYPFHKNRRLRRDTGHVSKNKNRRNEQYEKLKEITTILASSLKLYLNALAKRILPMERFNNQNGLTFFKGKHVVCVVVVNPFNIQRFQKLPDETPYSFINVSTVLAMELHQLSPYIKIKMVFLQTNPYWWDMDESEISSQVFYVELMQREEDDSWATVYSTKNNLDVHLSLRERKNTTMKGVATLAPPEADEMAKESSVTVYRVWPPLFGGGGTLFVRFVGLQKSDSLRVALTENLHPDFIYMNTYAQTVYDEHNEVSLRYDIKGKNTFLYIGVIPGPLFKRKDPESGAHFTFEAYIVRCLTRKHSMWLAKYCHVNTEEASVQDESRTHCLCNEYTGMIAAAIVAPRTELKAFIPVQFNRDAETNYIPLVTTTVLLSTFVVFLVWAYYRDRKNVSKRKVILLEDNFPGEEWPYLVGVYTGTRPWSGTDSNVGIQLFGDLANSRTHILRSSERQTLSSYSDDWFLLFSPKRLGKITKMHIWMDYAEKGADWYCRKIVVYDFSTKEKYLFRLSCWFYISLHSELLNVYMTPETSNKTSSRHMLEDNFASYFQELHYAISTIHHHPRSLMSGAEIVATLWTAIASSALLLLLFYKYDYSGTEDYFYFHLTTTDFLVALLGNVPSIIVSIIAKLLFRSKVVTRDSQLWKSLTEQFQNLEHSFQDNSLNENKKTVNTKNKNHHKIPKTNTKGNDSGNKSPHQHPITISEDSDEKVQISKGRKYTAWLIVVSLLLGLSLGIVVEGLSMSKKKSHIWLVVCCIALFIGLFISSTIRVVVHVLIATFIWKKPFDEPVFSCDPAKCMRTDKIGDKAHLDEILRMRSKSEYYPPKPKKIEDIRSQMKSKVLLTPLLELFTIFFIYFLVIFGTMNSWGSQNFHQRNHLTYVLTEANLDQSISRNGRALKHLQDLDQLKKYFQSTLNYMYSVTEWYNKMNLTFEDDKFPETGWLMDFTSRMIGVIQLRQKLVKTEDCMNPKFKERFLPVRCCPLLTQKNEDCQKYTVGWSPENETIVSDSESQWHYQEPDQPLSSFYSQDGRYYSDGGYVLNLGRTKQAITTIMWKMDEANWFSHRAEVIFIDSCIYNVNVNKLSIITVCLELGLSHGHFKSVSIVNFEVPTVMFDFYLIFWILLAVVLGLLIGNVAFMVFEYGVNFFYSFWNDVDFFIVVFFGLCYSYGLTNEFQIQFIKDNLNTGREKFVPYGWVDYYSEYYYFLFILLVVLSTVKLFKYFRITLQVDPIVRTLSSAGVYLSRIILICFPLLYSQFYITDCLLSNSQQPSNRFPLVNKVGLKNYAQQYVFPDNKFVPYLFCQFCTLLITLFSLLIVHHYKISKNSVFFPRNDVDILVFWREMWSNCSWRKKMRLRSGAEVSWEMSGGTSAPGEVTNNDCVVNEQSTSEMYWDEKCFSSKQNRLDMSIIYKNMDTKLDRIKEALVLLSDSLVDVE